MGVAGESIASAGLPEISGVAGAWISTRPGEAEGARRADPRGLVARATFLTHSAGVEVGTR